MAEDFDTKIRIGMEADLAGGVQTNDELDKLKRKAKELEKSAGSAANGTSGAFDRINGAVGKVSRAVRTFQNVLSGLGLVSFASGIVSGLKSIIDSFGSAKAEAMELEREIKRDEVKGVVDGLARSYDELQKNIRKSAEAAAHESEMLDLSVKAMRDAEDAHRLLNRQRELDSVDLDSPDANERIAEIEARYSAIDGETRAEREVQNLRKKQDALTIEAQNKDLEAGAIVSSTARDDEAIAKLMKRIQDASRESVSENERDNTGVLGKYTSSIRKVLTLKWGSVGDYRTEEGDRIRERAADEVVMLNQELERLKAGKAEKLEKARDLRTEAERARERREAIEPLIDAAVTRARAERMSGARRESAAVRASERKDEEIQAAREQLAADRETLAGAETRRAGIQGRIDAANARLAAAEDRARKEQADVDEARGRLAAADAGAGAMNTHARRRYVSNSRPAIESDIRREESEATAARFAFEQTRSEVGRILADLKREMDDFNRELKSAQGRIKASQDNGGAE